MKRALVIAPQWIGDAVMAEPLLARRWPSAASGSRSPRCRGSRRCSRAMPRSPRRLELPFAHGRLDWSARRRIARRAARPLRRRLRAAELDQVGAPAVARAACRERVGYRGEGRPFLLNRTLPNPPGRPPMVAFYGALAGAPASTAAAAAPGARGRVQLDAALASAGLQRGAYWSFAPGAEYGPAKRWPAAHYAALARSLHAADGAPVVLLGSPASARSAKRSPPTRPAPAASSPARRRCSRRWR